jgi:hypothetical protein
MGKRESPSLGQCTNRRIPLEAFVQRCFLVDAASNGEKFNFKLQGLQRSTIIAIFPLLFRYQDPVWPTHVTCLIQRQHHICCGEKLQFGVAAPKFKHASSLVERITRHIRKQLQGRVISALRSRPAHFNTGNCSGLRPPPACRWQGWFQQTDPYLPGSVRRDPDLKF